MTQTSRRQGARSQRSALTRRQLLEATIASLVDKGYSGTTTLEVQQRAGVSRGALLHHFSSRTELVHATVEHLMRERFAALQRSKEPTPLDDRLAWAVRTLWSAFEGPLFSASLELWLAARNDAELAGVLLPQERLFGAACNEWAAGLFGSSASHPRFPVLLAVLLDAMRGAAARRVLRNPSADERLLADWTVLAGEVLRPVA